MILLKQPNGLQFEVYKEFNVKYLEPILVNMLWKLKNEWDDYNELYHSCALVDNIKKSPDSWIDTHIITNGESVLGVVLIIGGKIEYEKYLKATVETKWENSVMLNYFHIAPEARGNGERWLCEVIIPYYKERGIMNIYLKSSHHRSHSLYSRLGVQIGEYSSQSDNQLYQRKGKIFKIDI